MKLHTLNCRAISHPIHRLPLELLEHIFHLLFEIVSEDKPYESPWDDAFPLHLTQVCSQWESLVLSVRNRRLWSTVRIDPADPDWLAQLHLYRFLSRDEGLNIHVAELTQHMVDELTGHHRRIRSLSGLMIFHILEQTTSEPDIVHVLIHRRFGKKPFFMPLSSSVTALPFRDLGESSLRRLQSFSQLQVLQIETYSLELDGPLQFPALRRLDLQVFHENPVDLLRIFAPSHLLDLHLILQGSLSPAAYNKLETFIIGGMPNLRWIYLAVSDYTGSAFVQQVEEPTTQSSLARQSKSLRRIDFTTGSPRIPPFERLIESAPHLEECYLVTPLNSLPCFSPHIRKFEFNFHGSSVLPVVNGELVKLVHLEVLKLALTTDEQLQLLTLLQAPSLLSLKVSYGFRYNWTGRSAPVDAILAFISPFQGIHDLELELPFPVDAMSLSLPELRNLKVTYMSHIFALASFAVPKLQHLFLKICDGRSEDESIAGGEDLEKDPIGIGSPPPSCSAVSNELDMVNTRQIPEIGEAQKRSTFEDDENGAEMNQFKDADLRKAPSDLVVKGAPIFPAFTFQHLKQFEFEVSTASDSHPRVLSYFPGIFTAFPALVERITLPAVSFNDSPYIDQLVRKFSEIPTLCPNLQEIRSRDYPNEWSNLLKFLRDRKRASILPNSTLRPIHALHFPITPHGSIVEQLQDAMLGKVSTKAFPAPCPWPLLINPTLVHMTSSRGDDSQVSSDEETRPQVQDGGERTAATHIQAQEKAMTGSGGKERQSEGESGCSKDEDRVLPCLFCHRAGLGAGCRQVFRKREIFSRMAVSSSVELCSRWDTGMRRNTEFEVICLP